MKRNITKLEENLIAKGWELDHKTYIGKHSEKVFQYVYEKVIDDIMLNGKTISARVSLSRDRTFVENIEVLINGGYVDELFLSFYQMVLSRISKEVIGAYQKNHNEDDDEEVVQVCEALQENE